ncbi:MAG: Gfo/Idh/MocA family oxidoreductase [candidate division WS1 bacterium]|nr:Gfo/Idh/MocA family oxidoreductase [candidate division WS1 bacterium]
MSLRVAVVGCGNIATRHISGYQQVEDAELVAMCDLDEARARDYAERFGGKAYTDVVTMLETEAPDIVDVCTREMHREAPVIQSVSRGFTTLAEKPLFAARGQYSVQADDLPVARRMVEATEVGGAELFMAYNYRFGDYAQRLKKMIEAGELGELQYVHAWTRLACWSHVIDLLRWFCGDIEAIAVAMSGPEDSRTRAGSLRFASGAVGTLLGEGITPGFHDMLRIRWCGSEGTAVLRDIAGGLELYPRHQRQRTIVQQAHDDPRGEFMQTFHREIAALCDHVRDGVEVPLATGIDGLRELEVDAGFVVAAERGEWLDLGGEWRS